MLTGQNGILNRASEAKDKTGISQEEESVKLSISDALTQGLGTIVTEDLRTALTNNGLNGPLIGNGPWTYTGVYRKYTIDQKGKIDIEQDVETDKLVEIVGDYGITQKGKLVELNFDENDDECIWKKGSVGVEINEIQEIKQIETVYGFQGKFYFILDKNGTVYAWFDNVDDKSELTKIEGISNASEIYVSGGGSIFARTDSGDVYACGNNEYGKLGIGNNEYQNGAVRVNGISNVENIYFGENETFFKTKTGEIYACGNNESGQLGIGNVENQNVPIKISGISNVEKVYINNGSIFAKTKLGEIYAWGYNEDGRLGVGNNENQNIPVKINELANVEEIYINWSSIFVKTKLGEMYAWGYNKYGVLGIGNVENQNVPIKISGISNVEKVYINNGSIFAKTKLGEIYAWGYNEDGRLGIGNTENQNTPIKIDNLKNIEKIIYYENNEIASVYAISTTGEVYAWGKNGFGELGIGNDETQYSPVKIEGLTKVSEIYTYEKSRSVYALTNTGKIYVWGANGCEQLGVKNENENEWKIIKPKCINDIQELNIDTINVFQIRQKSHNFGEITIVGDNTLFKYKHGFPE